MLCLQQTLRMHLCTHRQLKNIIPPASDSGIKIKLRIIVKVDE